MGEMAEAILEGIFCQWCGEYLDEGDGFPQVCAACKSESGDDESG